MERWPRMLTGTLLGIVAFFLIVPKFRMGPPNPEQDHLALCRQLFWCAFGGTLIGAVVEFIGRCWPLDPPPWSR